MQYEVRFKTSAWKTLLKLEREARNRLKEAIWARADDPRPPGCKKLKGYANYYRVRVGDLWVAYEIQDEALVVLVLKVGRRGGFYRRM